MSIQEGIYFIVSVFDGKRCIDLPEEHKKDTHSFIQHMIGNASINQQWRIRRSEGEEMYTIEWANPHFPGRYIAVYIDPGEHEKVGFVHGPPQPWKFIQHGDKYEINRPKGNISLDYWSDDPGFGGHLRIIKSNGSSQQRWLLQKHG